MPDAKPKLLELPEPDYHDCDVVKDKDMSGAYTPATARAIQAEAWNAAIEWAARVCDGLVFAIDHGGNSYRRPADAEKCAAAIRRAAVPTTGDNR